MITEAYLPVKEVMAYYGNKSHPIVHFPLNFMLISVSRKNVSAQSIYDAIRIWMDSMPEGAWPNWLVSWILFL